MVYDLSAGDVLHIGDAVTLTVLDIEGELIRFGLESSEAKRPDAGSACQHDNPTHGWWELN